VSQKEEFLLDALAAEDTESYAQDLVQDIIAQANDNYPELMVPGLRDITEISDLSADQQTIVFTIAREAIRKVVEILT